MTIIPFPGVQRPRAAEFFAGIGLARLGLESAGAEVVWANDLEAFKQEMYAGQFGADGHEFVQGDVRDVSGEDLPDIELAWSSFPCTDLSLAGNRAGLAGTSSSTFFQFTRVLREMGERRPPVIALENVNALANSRGGDDLAAAVRELNSLGYSVDVVAIDARRFVPQSRPRIFLIGALDAPDDADEPDSELRPDWLQTVYGDPTLRTHRAELPGLPAPLTTGFSETTEALDDDDGRWWAEHRVAAFQASLSPIQSARLAALIAAPDTSYRTAYRRTRAGVPVWEVRADDIAGCLRTARGGSSKQAVVRVGNGKLSVRWMTPREYARLMGAGDYRLEGLRDSQILFGFGDAVCVDVVDWLGRYYLMPLIERHRTRMSDAPELRSIHG